MVAFIVLLKAMASLISDMEYEKIKIDMFLFAVQNMIVMIVMSPKIVMECNGVCSLWWGLHQPNSVCFRICASQQWICASHC